MSGLKYTPEFKIQLVKEYVEEGTSTYQLARKYGVARTTLKSWIYQYNYHGYDSFIPFKTKPYTKEFKMACVEAVINGKDSIDQVVAKEGLSSRSVLRHWIKKYNANIELEDYIPLKEIYMAEARRKTSVEERKEIVQYCIDHNCNYKETAVKYEVSYGQVFYWVKKYKERGEEGLSDKRGHRLKDDDLAELERLRRENIRLKTQLEEKDKMVELLKKVKELERR